MACSPPQPPCGCAVCWLALDRTSADSTSRACQPGGLSWSAAGRGRLAGAASVPAATPIPRGPVQLTVYTAADLLSGPGCPVCRYTGEAADRYLGWFAMEGHADTVTVTRLCASLGMCARHTGVLMRQPGAARRLTAVYRYLVRAALDCLAGRAARSAVCPGCEHDAGAARRALETLLDGLADAGIRDRYGDLGGLCIAHLRAASVIGKRQVIAWLAQTMTAAVASGSAGTRWLAGADADAIAASPSPRSPAALPGHSGCDACRAAGRSDQARLARMAADYDRERPERWLLLCAGHLLGLVAQAGWPTAAPLLAWQADCLAAALTGPARNSGLPGWARPRPRRRAVPDDCPVCQSGAAAARRAFDELGAGLRAASPAHVREVPLCVRHLLELKSADLQAGRAAALGAIPRAESLIAELDQAFANSTWAHRHQTAGLEITAWRRAAAFLDGGAVSDSESRN